MEEDLHEYHGKDIEVSYDHNRCIHVRECVEGLSGVFDPNQRPWIDADNADADEVARVIERCPTGALHYERTDAGAPERIPFSNTVTATANGPLYLHGDIVIRSHDDDVVLEDTRVALCRCGHTMNEPLCDNSHARVFKADGAESANPTVAEEIEDRDVAEGDTADMNKEEGGDDQLDGQLVVTPTPSGPIILEGAFELHHGGELTRLDEAALCRCGGSANKPFCDGTHAKIGFTTDAEE